MPHGGRHALDFKAFDHTLVVAALFDGIAEGLDLTRQLVLIDFAPVPDGFDHFAAFERDHAALPLVPGGVRHDEMRVELGIERAAGVVAKHGGAQVARGAGVL